MALSAGQCSGVEEDRGKGRGKVVPVGLILMLVAVPVVPPVVLPVVVQ